MLRFASDENFNQRLLKALLGRVPTIDLVRVQDAGFAGVEDPLVLAWVAQEQRVLLTSDFATMPDFACARIAAGQPMPGLIMMNSMLSISAVIEDLILLVIESKPGERENQVIYLPF